jgi:hypothetical protein
VDGHRGEERQRRAAHFPSFNVYRARRRAQSKLPPRSRRGG